MLGPSLQAKDRRERAEKALAAANEATHTVSSLYITFLLLGTYIGIIIASTTDEQLLRISSVTLPLLNVQLPIRGFYIFAPWLFLLFHFDLLLHFALLGRKLRVFDQFAADLLGAESMVLREQLSNFPFVHMLVGWQHDNFLRWLLTQMVRITMIILPLGLLLWAQIVFLPYHDPVITWGQQVAVLVDAWILMFFWGRIESSQRVKFLIPVTLTAVFVSFLNAILILPIVPVRGWVGKLDLVGRVLTLNELPAEVITALREGKGEQREQALQKVLGIDLQGRDLRYARLSKSILPKADLRGAQLQGADLEEAQLQGADLRWAQLQRADLNRAQLQGARLGGTWLQGADLRGAQLQGADLEEAQLQGAYLREAQLQGAYLRWAQLQGARLGGTQLQGADLRGAQLQGADLEEAQLQGAYLLKAQLEGADLREARIGGAGFEDANLDFTDLRDIDRKPLTEEAYQKLGQHLEREIHYTGRRTHVLARLKTSIGKEDTLKKATSAVQCLSGELKPLTSCITNEADFSKARVSYLVGLACYDRDPDVTRGVAQRAFERGIIKVREIAADKIEIKEIIGKIPAFAGLATALLQAKCEAVKELPEDIQKSLRQVVELKKSSSPSQER